MLQTNRHIGGLSNSWVLDYYFMKIGKWKDQEPNKLRLISHYLWRKQKPTLMGVMDELDYLEEKFGYSEINKILEEWHKNE